MFLGSFVVAMDNLKAYKRSSNLSTLKEVLDDFREICDNNIFDLYEQDLRKWKEQMVETQLNPLNFYYQSLPRIAKIGEFYEFAGMLVRKDLIDFELMFEVLPFPDKFWIDTEEFRQAMRDVSYAGFWDNFSYLREQYIDARKGSPTPKRSLMPKSVAFQKKKDGKNNLGAFLMGLGFLGWQPGMTYSVQPVALQVENQSQEKQAPGSNEPSVSSADPYR